MYKIFYILLLLLELKTIDIKKILIFLKIMRKNTRKGTLYYMTYSLLKNGKIKAIYGQGSE